MRKNIYGSVKDYKPGEIKQRKPLPYLKPSTSNLRLVDPEKSLKCHAKSLIHEKNKVVEENSRLKKLCRELDEEVRSLKSQFRQQEHELFKFKELNCLRRNSKATQSEKRNSYAYTLTTLRENLKYCKGELNRAKEENKKLRSSVKAIKITELKQQVSVYYNEWKKLQLQIQKPRVFSVDSQEFNLSQQVQNLKEKLEFSQKEISELKQENQLLKDQLKSSQKVLTRKATIGESNFKQGLKRELAPTKEALISNFFRKLCIQLENNQIDAEHFSQEICKDSQVDFEQLQEKFNSFKLVFSENELQKALELIFQNKTNPNVLVKQLKSKQLELESDLSSDVSSINSRSHSPNSNYPFTEDIELILNELRLRVMDSGKSSEYFLEKWKTKLPEPVTSESLNDLFLDESYRIEDPVHRIKLTAFFLNSQKSLTKDSVLQSLKKEIFREFKSVFDVSEKLKDFHKTLSEKKEKFLDTCKEFDCQNSGFLDWYTVLNILEDIGITITPELYKLVQFKCFKLKKSLETIPYRDLDQPWIVHEVLKVPNYLPFVVEEPRETIRSIESTTLLETDPDHLMETRDSLLGQRQSVTEFEFN